MAQPVIYNPGYCAQYYPNANCQNLGPGNPYTDNYRRPDAGRDSYAYYNGGQGSAFYTNSYAARKGFACEPGSRIRGGDGRMHICR